MRTTHGGVRPLCVVICTPPFHVRIDLPACALRSDLHASIVIPDCRICLGTVARPRGAAQAQTLDDIIAANLQIEGRDREDQSDADRCACPVRWSLATCNGHDITGTMTMVAKRPNLMRRDADVGGSRSSMPLMARRCG